MATILAAALLVVGVISVFVTSKVSPKNIDTQPQNIQTNTDPAMPLGDGAILENTPIEETFIWPLPQENQEITFPFTTNITRSLSGQALGHLAIDIAAPEGTTVYAAKSGKVTRSELDETYGNLVELSHDDGTATLYAHLSKRNTEVGQKVKQGETIGTVGATGKITDPALHFSILVNSNPVDPAEYFEIVLLTTPDAADNCVPPVTYQSLDSSEVPFQESDPVKSDTSTPPNNRVHPVTG